MDWLAVIAAGSGLSINHESLLSDSPFSLAGYFPDQSVKLCLVMSLITAETLQSLFSALCFFTSGKTTDD